MKLGRIANTNVHLDWTVSLLLLLMVSSVFEVFTTRANTFVALVVSVLWGVLVILSVLAHEFGHILVGRKFGTDFDDVYLHAFGGAAVMSNAIKSAKGEFWMALAGPVVSFVLGLVGIGLFYASHALGLPFVIKQMWFYLGVANGTMAVFNMIPAFPLDGGRIFRAAMWKVFDYRRATRVAAWSGMVFGALFILTGVLMVMRVNVPFFGTGFGGIWQALIGWLIIKMAQSELRVV